MINHIGIIGCGSIGASIAQGLMESGTVARELLWASTRSETSRSIVERNLQIRVFSPPSPETFLTTQCVIVAVKPRHVHSTLESLRSLLAPDTLVISVVTGVTTHAIDEALCSAYPVVRVITNTGCLVRKAVNAIVPGPGAGTDHVLKARSLFAPLGELFEIEESLCDVVTSMSGSGIAFLYLVIEALTDGGVRLGLPRQAAARMAANTMIGAGEMVLQSDKHPAHLRDDVTTPGGCTIEGLLVLEDGRLRSTISTALEKATAVARSLGVPSKGS